MKSIIVFLMLIGSFASAGFMGLTDKELVRGCMGRFTEEGMPAGYAKPFCECLVKNKILERKTRDEQVVILDKCIEETNEKGVVNE